MQNGLLLIGVVGAMALSQPGSVALGLEQQQQPEEAIPPPAAITLRGTRTAPGPASRELKKSSKSSKKSSKSSKSTSTSTKGSKGSKGGKGGKEESKTAKDTEMSYDDDDDKKKKSNNSNDDDKEKKSNDSDDDDRKDKKSTEGGKLDQDMTSKEKDKKEDNGKEKGKKSDGNDKAAEEENGMTGEDKAVEEDDGTTANAIRTRYIPDFAVRYTVAEGVTFTDASDKDYEELFYTTKISVEDHLENYLETTYGSEYNAYSDITLLGSSAPNIRGVVLYFPKVHFYKNSGKVPKADVLATEMMKVFAGSNYIDSLNGMSDENPFSKTTGVEYLAL